MDDERICDFDETNLSELTQTIKDINPELFKKIVENNKECYFNKKFTSSINNYQLDKIESKNNIHIDDLLNSNNISNLKIYYKSILLICKTYKITQSENFKCSLYNNKISMSNMESIIFDFTFENITMAIDILYNYLIDYNYAYNDYIHNTYLSYFLLIKTINSLYIINKNNNIDELLCNGYIFNNHLKNISAPINILNTITDKIILENCILLIINTDCISNHILNINLNLSLVCEYHIKNKPITKNNGCIDFTHLYESTILNNLLLFVNMYHFINNKLIIPILVNIVKISIKTTNIINIIEYVTIAFILFY